MLDTLIALFHQYGYYLIFLALLLENIVFVGLVIPGETVLLASSFLAARGEINFAYVLVLAVAAAWIGNNIGYWVGRSGGRTFLERYGRYFHVSEARIKAAEAYFEAHGPKTVFIGRFAAGVRGFVAPLAGASRMGYGKFLGYTTSAILVWTAVLGALGYFFGENWDRLVKDVALAGWIGFALIGVIVAVYVYRRRKSGETAAAKRGAGAADRGEGPVEGP